MEPFHQGVLYRRVYAHVLDQARRFYAEVDPAELRAEPLQGLNIAPETLADPEAAEVLAEAVEDALAGRRPRW